MSMLDKEKNLSKEEDIIRGKLLRSELLLSEGNYKLKKLLRLTTCSVYKCSSDDDLNSQFNIEKLGKEMDSLRTRQKEVEKGNKKDVRGDN